MFYLVGFTLEEPNYTTECNTINMVLAANMTNPINEDDRMVLKVFLSLVTIASIVCNTAALILLPRRNYQTLYKGCLASLSLSDLFLAVFVGLDNITRFHHPDITWYLGDAMCSLLPLFTTVSILASSFTLTVIALDRFQGLIRIQEKVKLGRVGTSVILVLIWALSFGTASPMYLYYKNTVHCVFDPTEPFCDNCLTFACLQCVTLCLVNPDIKIYFPILYSIIFVPLLVMFLVSYIVLARHVWNTRDRKTKEQSVSTTMETLTTSAATLQRSAAPPKTDYTKRKLRTFKVILAVIFAFVVCRLPQWTFILISFLTSLHDYSDFILKAALTMLAIANTATNPLLYIFLDDILKLKISCSKNIRRFCSRWKKVVRRKKTAYTVQT